MPTQEERLAELERKVAAMELQRLYDERKASENTSSVQAHNYSEINHNLAMLLGIASGQEHAIRLIQGDLDSLKERVESIEWRLDGVDRRLDGIDGRLDGIDGRLGSFEQSVAARFETLEGRLGSFEQSVAARFETLEGRLDSFEQSVTARFEGQDRKLDDLGRLLLQILDRLPPSSASR